MDEFSGKTVLLSTRKTEIFKKMDEYFSYTTWLITLKTEISKKILDMTIKT